MKFKITQHQTFSEPRTTLCDLHNLLCIFKPFSTLTSPIKQLPLQQQELPSYYTLSQTLQECISTRYFRTANSVHAHLIKLHPDGLVSLWNKLLNLYSKGKPIGRCRILFDEMPQRDVVSYNTIISAYVRGDGGMRQGVLLYGRMHEEGVRANNITLSTLIGAKANLEMVHGQAIRYGLSSNEFVGSSLVDGYAKRMRLEDAIRAFDEIAELDLVSWNIMIDGCVCNGNRQIALRMFLRLRNEGVEFDGFTLTSVIKACLEPSDLEQGMQLHGCAVKVGLGFETPIGNALITMYSKCEKVMASSVKIFDEILAPNIISWTAMVSGFMQNGLNREAILFYHRMLRLGVNENEFSFASILPAYSSLASLEQGMQVHARIIKTPFQLDLSVVNALIDMYFKCGSLTDAELAFRTMERHDVVSWTIMVTGLGQHGKAKEAVDVLKEMVTKGMKPDAVTFLGSISACSHGGLVDEGLRIFGSMIDVHHVKPRREHYACVVDMLGRAGRLEEAERFIVDMGIDSDALVWEALLGACKTHGEMELGERAAKKIMDLEPRKNGPYVLLANLYADNGLWQGKSLARESLSRDGLRKEAGSSWVATRNLKSGHSKETCASNSIIEEMLQ